MFKKMMLIIIVLSILFITGCKQETESVKKAVRDYNNLLIFVLDTGDLKRLNEVATDKEVRRMELLLSSLNEEKKILQAKLQSSSTKSVQITKGNDKSKIAIVKAYETWKYQYINSENGQRMGLPEKLQYDITYKLVYNQNKWLVDEIDFKEKVGD